MKILYLNLNMGASGDMLTAALLGLYDNPDSIIEKLNSVNLPHTKTAYSTNITNSIKCGSVDVLIDDQTEEYNSAEHGVALDEILAVINSADIPEKVKNDAVNVYKLITDSESKAHGTAVDKVHFHEVGMLDAIADVLNVCYLIYMLDVDKIIASPVNTGSGFVKTAHGILPVPAPATALLLTDIPSYYDGTECELCTPTGAALVKYFADEFADRPVMRIEKVSYGAGKKKLDKLNAVTAYLGENDSHDTITQLSFNIDDMTGEEIAFTMDKLLQIDGVVDVFATPIIMKKGRPASMITCLCKEECRDTAITAIFKHTTTLGIRINSCERAVLERRIKTVKIELGDVRIKEANGYGVCRYKPEFDDISAIALNKNLSLREVEEAVKKEVERWKH